MRDAVIASTARTGIGRPRGLPPDRTAVLLYTSGTTGRAPVQSTSLSYSRSDSSPPDNRRMRERCEDAPGQPRGFAMCLRFQFISVLQRAPVPDLDLQFYGLTAADLDTIFQTSTLSIGQSEARLGAIIEALEKTYCGTVGALDPTRKLDKGIIRAVWMTPDEIRNTQPLHRSPLVWQSIEDYFAGKCYPLEMLQTL